MLLVLGAAIVWYVLSWFVVLWITDDTFSCVTAVDFLMIWVLSPVVFPMAGLTFVVSYAFDVISDHIKRRNNA